VHVGTKSETQHQCAPFCAVQAWGPLAAMKLSHATGGVVASEIRIGAAT
jgi:7,8-dihydro-6-hydroxymethylpterin dimethyltransferase